MARITIFHTGDLHGRLSETAADRIRKIRLENSPALLLDAGDAVSAGNIGVRLKGEEILRRMGLAGYDALAMGNREFHPGKRLLEKKLQDAGFPVLCANLREPRPLPVESHRFYEIGGIRLAVFGLCVPMITPEHWARRISPFLFDEPIETASRLVPLLKREASIVVALTHIGLDADRRLASSVPGIDLILGGHSHTPLDEPEGSHPAILHVAPYGKEIGQAVIESDGDESRLVSWDRISIE